MTDKITTTYKQLLKKWRETNPETRASLINQAAVDFSYNSGRMENEGIELVDMREMFENGKVESFSGDPETLQEIENFRRAWDWTLRFVSGTEGLTVANLMELHKVLMDGTYDEEELASGEQPGTFRKSGYTDDDSEFRPESVEKATRELVGELDEVLRGDDLEKSGLTVAAYAHDKLVSISPFAEGNERVARQLMDCILMQANMPPIIVHEANKAAYYGAITAFTENLDLDATKTFIRAETISTWGRVFRVM